MINSYVEMLVKRNVKEEKQLRKKIMILVILALIISATLTKMPVLYCLLISAMFGYYFVVAKYCIEFEYFYMDSELTITKIFNRSRRKNIASIKAGMIKLIAPIGAAELQAFQDIKRIDCTANDSRTLPYVILCEYENKLRAIHIQMNEELYLELKRDMPYKVKKY